MPLPKNLRNASILIGEELVKNNKFNDALDAIKKSIFFDNPKNRTISNRYSLFKKEMRQYTDDQEFLNKIKPRTELTNQLIKENQRIRDQEKTMLDIDKELIEKIVSLKDSNNAFDIIIFLMFCSGRRSSEIRDAKFTLDPENKEQLIIDGLKKTRNGITIQSFKPICAPAEFLSLLKELREFNLNKTTFNTLLNRRVKKVLGSLSDSSSMNSHKLRGVYSIYRFRFDNPGNLKINSFIKDALNHDSLTSSLSYTGFKILFNEKINI